MRHIICFGNALHGDDGFGPAVYRQLVERPLPESVRVFDAGTCGLAALNLFEDCDEALIVDCTMSGGRPGSLSEIEPGSLSPENPKSAHGSGVAFLLEALTALPGPTPRLRIYAAEAESIRPFSPGLSEPVAQAVQQAAAWIRLQYEEPYRG
jgi:hydrogenase maturation protease